VPYADPARFDVASAEARYLPSLAVAIVPENVSFVTKTDDPSPQDGIGEEDSIVIAPDGTRSGTNALMLRPADALPFSFGPGSYEAHLQAARERGLAVRVCERPHLAFDLDTAEDLARLDEETP
jgi:2-phospho-L-lactate/phosphoenolpyruvate guanylyltransferase